MSAPLTGMLFHLATGELHCEIDGPPATFVDTASEAVFGWLEVPRGVYSSALHMVDNAGAEAPVIVDKPPIAPDWTPGVDPGEVEISNLPDPCQVWWAEEDPVEVTGGAVLVVGPVGVAARLIVAADRHRTYRGEITP